MLIYIFGNLAKYLFNILLKVMDYGKLTDNNDKSVDFRNVILIMTTNAGAFDISKKGIGFNSSRLNTDLCRWLYFRSLLKIYLPILCFISSIN